MTKHFKKLTETLMSPPIFSELFRRRDISYNLRSNFNFAVPNGKSVFHGIESISYLGPKTWDNVPFELTSLNAFKKGIKKWQAKNCPCRLCKKYISNLGFTYFQILQKLVFNCYVIFNAF